MYTFITNPVAGTGYALKVEKQIMDRMKELGKEARFLHTDQPGNAARIAVEAAAEPGCEGIISVGGDGTAFEVACGLMESNIPLGIIPAGTGNDFIKSTKAPKDPMQALDFILNHKARPVDVGRINDRLFLNVCGTGFDVTVLENTLEAKKHFRGLLPYMIGLIKALGHYRPVSFTLTVDEQERGPMEAVICTVANGIYIGGGIPISPASKIDDGFMDLVLVHRMSLGRIITLLPALMRGKILNIKETEHLLCRKVHLSGKKLKVNIDGEIFEMDDAEFELLPGSLQMFW